MQGRLSPSVPGRAQAFPWLFWEEEFARARECGFDTIEWLFDAERFVENPLWTVSGRERIRQQVAVTGTSVRSVCAHYFMTHSLFRVPESERARNIEVLDTLIIHGASVGVRTILVPVLETCEIRTEAERTALLEALRRPLDVA